MNLKELHLLVFTATIITTFASAQVPSYVPTNGLVGWFPFDNNTNDLSSSANNGINNGATFIADRNGNPNAAMNFDGSSSFIEITAPSFVFAETDSFAYSIWLNKQTPLSGGGVALFMGDNTTGNFISLIQGDVNTQFGTNMQQSAWVWATCPHTLNVWDHYVATYENKVMNLYKNGVFQSTATYTYSGATATVLPLYFGKAVSGNFYNGDIDDIGIWHRSLSQQEITDLFSAVVTTKELNTINDFAVFPNPANDVIQIKTDNTNVGSVYSITDIAGRKVLNGKIASTSITIDISELQAGVYFFETRNNSNQKIKLLKK